MRIGHQPGDARHVTGGQGGGQIDGALTVGDDVAGAAGDDGIEVGGTGFVSSQVDVA